MHCIISDVGKYFYGIEKAMESDILPLFSILNATSYIES